MEEKNEMFDNRPIEEHFDKNSRDFDGTHRENISEDIDRDSEIMQFKQTLDDINDEFKNENFNSESTKDNEEDFNMSGGENFLKDEENMNTDFITEEENMSSDFVKDDEDGSSDFVKDDEEFGADIIEREEADKTENLNGWEDLAAEPLEKENTVLPSAFSENEVDNQAEVDKILPILSEEIDKTADNGRDSVADRDNDEKEYETYRVKKILSLIDYNLMSPLFTLSDLKILIMDGMKYQFNNFAVLSSKVSGLIPLIKKNKIKICSVIGYDKGESLKASKMLEIRRSKAAKVSEIAIFMPYSEIKEGVRKNIVRDYAKYKKMCGKNIKLKVIIDCCLVRVNELKFAVSCAVDAKVDSILLYNYDKVPQIYALRAANICNGNCKVEVSGKGLSGKDILALIGKGANTFYLEDAAITAEKVKAEHLPQSADNQPIA